MYAKRLNRIRFENYSRWYYHLSIICKLLYGMRIDTVKKSLCLFCIRHGKDELWDQFQSFLNGF